MRCSIKERGKLQPLVFLVCLSWYGISTLNTSWGEVNQGHRILSRPHSKYSLSSVSGDWQNMGAPTSWPHPPGINLYNGYPRARWEMLIPCLPFLGFQLGAEGKDSLLCGCTCLEWSFQHPELRDGKEGAGSDSDATDAHYFVPRFRFSWINISSFSVCFRPF